MFNPIYYKDNAEQLTKEKNKIRFFVSFFYKLVEFFKNVTNSIWQLSRQ